MKQQSAPTKWLLSDITFVAIAITCVVIGMIIIVLLFASSYRVHAANNPGDLDPTFGNGGKVITVFQSGGFGTDLAIQPDGKIIVSGGNGPGYLLLARYNPDGTLDPLFGSGGKVAENISKGLYMMGSSVGLLPDGRIVAAGWGLPASGASTSAVTVFRPDGNLDRSFGIIKFTNVWLGKLAVQPDGRIVVAGSNFGSSPSSVLFRYNPDGSIDPSFGSGGKVVLSIPNLNVSAGAPTVQSDGRILVVGSSSDPNLAGSSQFTVMRLNTDGSLDTTFGAGGFVRTDFAGERQEYANEIVVQPDGRILVVGYSGSQASSDLALVRYNSDGSLDTSFGDGGKVTTDFAGKDFPRDLALQSDGRIVVAAGPSFGLVRYNSDGRVDSTFGNGGVVSTDFSDGSVQLLSEVHGLAYLGNDRLLAVGGSSRPGQMGSSGFVLARYYANSTPTSSPTATPTATPTSTPGTSPSPTPTPPTSNSAVQFSASNYDVTEDCTTVTITVNRVGDTSAAASVDYSTANVSAIDRGDYITAFGTLDFAARENSKTFAVLINEDSYVEGNETFNVTLSNPVGTNLGASVATVTIYDDPSEPATNPIDDPVTFVCQHYHDFLNRHPDQSGWEFWTHEITSCGTEPQCIEIMRINVSASFFLSIEFQETGYFVERMYKVAYGDDNGNSTLSTSNKLSVPVIRWQQFLRDTQRISQGVVVGQPSWETILENNKQAFAREFVERPDFYANFPESMTPTQFFTKLNENLGTHMEYGAYVIILSFFGNATDIRDENACARAIRWVAEDYLRTPPPFDFQRAEFNRAFVLMQYFGYLRRNPNDSPDADHTGYDFWLTKLNQFNGNFVEAEMVKAFITSIEYRQRFGQ